MSVGQLRFLEARRCRYRLTIEVEDLDRLAVDLGQGAQGRKRQAVVATEGHELGLGGEGADGPPPAELLEGLGHLLAGDVVVDRGDGDVAAVDDLGPVLVRVDAGARVEAAERRLAGRSLADGARAEAGSRAVRHGRVEGCADDGDVEGLGGLGEALDVVEVGEGADAVEGPLDDGIVSSCCPLSFRASIRKIQQGI